MILIIKESTKQKGKRGIKTFMTQEDRRRKKEKEKEEEKKTDKKERTDKDTREKKEEAENRSFEFRGQIIDCLLRRQDLSIK